MLPRLPRFQREQPEVELRLSTSIDPPDLRGGPDAVLLHGLVPERPLRFGSSLLPPQAALHGLGVALADQSLVAAELDAGRLVNPAPALPPLAALRDWLLREAQTGLRDGPARLRPRHRKAASVQQPQTRL